MSLSVSTSVEVRAQVEENGKAFILENLPALAPVVLIYLFLAFYRIDYQSFWTDEVASLSAATPQESLFSPRIWINGQGPLYFALLHIWMTIGDSEFVVRSLAAIWGGVAVFLTYIFGLRLGDCRFATVSALLMATSPFLIWYSQETRYITLAITMGLLSMYFFHRALSSKSAKPWLFYAGSTALALFAFVPNVFVIMGQGIYVVCLGERARIMRWLGYLAGVIVVFTTWLAVIYGGVSIANITGSAKEVERAPVAALETGTAKEISLLVIPYTFFAFSNGFSVGPSVEELHISREVADLLKHLPTVAPLAVLFGSLFLFGAAQLCSRTHAPRLLLLWLVLPVVAVFIISAMCNVAYNVRYICAALPAYIFILAFGITSLRKRTVQLGVLLAVLSANGLSLAQYYYNPRYAKADARAAAHYLESAGDSREAILFIGSSTAFQYYYKGKLPIVRWGMAINSDHDSINTNVQELISRYDRLWLVEIRPWETDPKGNVKAVFKQSLQSTHNIALPGVEISSYMRKRSLS